MLDRKFTFVRFPPPLRSFYSTMAESTANKTQVYTQSTRSNDDTADFVLISSERVHFPSVDLSSLILTSIRL